MFSTVINYKGVDFGVLAFAPGTFIKQGQVAFDGPKELIFYAIKDGKVIGKSYGTNYGLRAEIKSMQPCEPRDFPEEIESNLYLEGVCSVYKTIKESLEGEDLEEYKFLNDIIVLHSN